MLTLIAGAGYTGGRILERLPDAFGLKRATTQNSENTATLNLDTTACMPVDLGGDYRVIYTVPPAGDSGDERLRRFLKLLGAAPRTFVYISTTGVYGDCGGAKIDETVTVNPCTQRALRRVDAERQLDAWADASGSRLVILRVPSIYGPGRLGEKRLHQGEPVLLEEAANPGNRIHVDDLANCCIAALDAPAGIYNVGDGDHRSSTWFASEVARQFGLAQPLQVSRDELAKTLSAQRLSFLSESRRVDTQKMRAVLGFTPTYANAEDGIRASHQDGTQT